MKRLVLALAVLLCSAVVHAQKINIGHKKSFYVCSDGSVYGFGYIDTIANHLQGPFTAVPKRIPGLADVDTVVTTKAFNFFLKTDGTVWLTNSLVTSDTFAGIYRTAMPTQVPGLTDIVSMSAAYLSNTLIRFVKSDGTVWRMPSNSTVPQQVQGISNVRDIFVTDSATLYLKKDGTVWATGKNRGQLGDMADPYDTPTQIEGLSDIVSLSSRLYDGSFFVSKQGMVYHCGNAFFGRGDYTIRRLDVIDSVKVAMDCGSFNAFLKYDGSIYIAGWFGGGISNGEPYGYLSSNPVKVTKVQNVKSMSYVDNHTLVLTNDDSLFAADYNQAYPFGRVSTMPSTGGLRKVEGLCLPGPPPPPQVDFSNFPSSLCLGGNLDVFPQVSGSNPEMSYSVDSSIQITAPKAICKNSSSVFVLNGNDEILRYGSDGSLLYTYNQGGSIANISAITADDNQVVYADNGSGYIHRFYANGTSDNVQSFWLFGAQSDLLYAPTNYLDEDIFVLEPGTGNLTGIDMSNSDAFSNSNSAGSFGPASNVISSMTLLKSQNPEPVLLGTETTTQTVWSRKLYDLSGTGDLKLLIDSSVTTGLELDFVDADTVNNLVLFSSSTKGGVYYGEYQFNGAGVEEFYFFPNNIAERFNIEKPVGAVTLKSGNTPTIWVADQAKNRLVRYNAYVYQIFPELPKGLKFNVLTGKVEGTPTEVMSAQTFAIIVTDWTGTNSDTSYFTFSVSPTNNVSNNTGTQLAEADVNDGKTIRYYTRNNCEKLIDIADSIGGGSPGTVSVSQEVLPTIAVFKNTDFLRRTTEITAEHPDSVKATIKIYYTYEDVALFNQSKGSTVLSNDTTAGTMQVAVLQLHDRMPASYETIKHSPIDAKWSSAEQHWEVAFPVTKFSRFYTGSTADVQSFSCEDTSSFTVVTNNATYTWANQSFDSSGIYEDVFLNSSGCDSTVTLYLTINSSANAITPMLDGAIQIFPNPSSDVFHLTCTNPNVQVQSIVVYNAVGAVVYSSNRMENGTHDIHLGNELKGLYFVHVRSNAEHIVRPIVLK